MGEQCTFALPLYLRHHGHQVTIEDEIGSSVESLRRLQIPDW
jgi:hypothetical protein